MNFLSQFPANVAFGVVGFSLIFISFLSLLFSSRSKHNINERIEPHFEKPSASAAPAYSKAA